MELGIAPATLLRVRDGRSFVAHYAHIAQHKAQRIAQRKNRNDVLKKPRERATKGAIDVQNCNTVRQFWSGNTAAISTSARHPGRGYVALRACSDYFCLKFLFLFMTLPKRQK
jgi:hypothetical protein